MLLRADARILRDIGLTRVDVRGLVAGHWWTHTSRRLLATAAARRNDAIAAAAARQACVVRIEAPPLAPAIDSVVIEGRCPRNAA